MMIENESQLKFNQFKLDILTLIYNHQIEFYDNTTIQLKAQLEGMESIINDLEKQIEEYNDTIS